MAHAISSDRHMHYDDHDRTAWSAALSSGVIAGIVFLMAEMLMVAVFLGQSPWGPPRMIAAMMLGTDVLPPPADFSMKIMMVAMMIHLVMSIAIGLITGWILNRLGSMSVVLIGGAIGLAIYFINFYLIAPVAFPWFAQAQNWVSLVAHVIFGLALGGAYAALRKHKPAVQS